MALQLRRGTNTERQTITPAEGELVYTTDTKALYVGDGTTVGGNVITSSGGGGGGTSTAPELANYRLRRDIWDSFRYYPGTLSGFDNANKTLTSAALEWGSTLVELYDHSQYKNLSAGDKLNIFPDTLNNQYKVIFWQYFTDTDISSIQNGTFRDREYALHRRIQAIVDYFNNNNGAGNLYHGTIGFQFEENTNNIGATSGLYGVNPATPRQHRTLFFALASAPIITYETNPITSPLIESFQSWQMAIRYELSLTTNPLSYQSPSLVGNIAHSIGGNSNTGHNWIPALTQRYQGWLYTLNSLREISSTCRFSHFLFPQKIISGDYPPAGEIWLKNESFVGGQTALPRDVYALYICEEDTTGATITESFLKDNFLSSGKEITIQDDETVDPLYNLVGSSDPTRSIILDTLPYRNTYNAYNIQKFTPSGSPISFTGDQYVTDQTSTSQQPWDPPDLVIVGEDLYITFVSGVWNSFSQNTKDTITNNFPLGTNFAARSRFSYDTTESTYNGNNIIFKATVAEHPYQWYTSIFNGGDTFTFKFTQSDLGVTYRYAYGYNMWSDYSWFYGDFVWSFIKLGPPPPGYYKLWCTQSKDNFFSGGNIFNPMSFQNRNSTRYVGYSSNIDLVGTIFEQDTATDLTSGNTYRVLDSTSSTNFYDIPGFDYILQQPPYYPLQAAGDHFKTGASFTVLSGSTNKAGLTVAKLRTTPGKVKLTSKLKDIIGPESIELNTSTALTYRYKPEPGATYDAVATAAQIYTGDYSGYVYRGLYNTSVIYNISDLVEYDGSFYEAVINGMVGMAPQPHNYPNTANGWRPIARYEPALPFSTILAASTNKQNDSIPTTFGNFYSHFVRYDSSAHNSSNTYPFGPFDDMPNGYNWAISEVTSFYFSTISYNGHNNADYIRVLARALYNRRMQGGDFLGALLKLNQIVKPTRTAQVSDTNITAGSRQVIYRISNIALYAGSNNLVNSYGIIHNQVNLSQIGHFRLDVMPYNGVTGDPKRPILLNWPGGKFDNQFPYLNANEIANTVFSIEIEIL